MNDLYQTQNQTPLWTTANRAIAAALLGFWFAAAYYIGAGQLLQNVQASVFAPIALTAFVPVALFLSAYLLLPRFRAFVLAQDMRTLTMLQHVLAIAPRRSQTNRQSHAGALRGSPFFATNRAYAHNIWRT